MFQDEDCKSPMKLLGGSMGEGVSPGGVLSSSATRNCLVNLGPKLESDSLLSSPITLAGTGGLSASAAAALMSSALSKENNMKPLVVRLTPLDEEVSVKTPLIFDPGLSHRVFTPLISQSATAHELYSDFSSDSK